MPHYIFDENSHRIFTSGLSSQTTTERINLLLESNELTAINLAAEIKNILLSNAQNCKLKLKKGNKNNDNSAPWFDKECNEMKTNLRTLGKSLKRDPGNGIIRNSLLQHKRLFRQLVRQKKFKYKQNILNEIASKRTNNKDFWKLLDRLSPKKSSISGDLNHDVLTSHFKSLLNTNVCTQMPRDSNEMGQLDYIITLEELKKASAILKPGKALGIDNVSNEMIICLLENHPRIILKLFN